MTVHVRPSVSVQAPRSGADPCTMIIMGAMGDLTRRKLMPAIYALAKEGLLAESFAVLGSARDEGGDEMFRDTMEQALKASDEIKNFDAKCWEWLRPRLFYVSADFAQNECYLALEKKLGQIEAAHSVQSRNRMFYLAVPPSVFTAIVHHLSSCGPRPPKGTERGRGRRP